MVPKVAPSVAAGDFIRSINPYTKKKMAKPITTKKHAFLSMTNCVKVVVITAQYKKKEKKLLSYFKIKNQKEN
jgi:hypothetical protein